MVDMPVSLYRLEISKGSKLVLSYLWRFAGRDRFVWPSRMTIAHDLGIDNERSLRRYLGELRRAGVIEEGAESRRGRLVQGWWLRSHDDVAARKVDVVCEPGQGASLAEAAEESSTARVEGSGECADLGGRPGVEYGEPGADETGREPAAVTGQNWPAKTGRGRTELAALPAKTGRGRTELAALPDKTGRPYLLEEPPIELPILSGSQPRRSTSPLQGGTQVEPGERGALPLLRRWRTQGGDPEGLGPWPRPVTPEGVELPVLAMSDKLGVLLREERTALEVHRAVHLVAELVEAGELPAERWRAGYVFSGWFDELVVKALERRSRCRREAERREAERRARTRRESEAGDEAAEEGPTHASMIETLAASKTLGGLAATLDGAGQARAGQARAGQAGTRRAPGSSRVTDLALVNLRIQVQGVAEQLERPTEDVLRALGRSSMKSLKLGDSERIKQVFVALRGGTSVEALAGSWAPGGGHERVEEGTGAIVYPRVGARGMPNDRAAHEGTSNGR